MVKRKITVKSKAAKKKNTKKVDIKKIEKTIKSIIAEIAEVNVKKITPKARFVEDLGMDSMMALEILAAIEKTYNIEIPEEQLPKMTSLNEVIKLTKTLVSENGTD